MPLESYVTQLLNAILTQCFQFISFHVCSALLLGGILGSSRRCHTTCLENTSVQKAWHDTTVETCWNMLKHVETCWNMLKPASQRTRGNCNRPISQIHSLRLEVWVTCVYWSYWSQQYTWHMLSHDVGWHPIQQCGGGVHMLTDTVIHGFCIRIDEPQTIEPQTMVKPVKLLGYIWPGPWFKALNVQVDSVDLQPTVKHPQRSPMSMISGVVHPTSSWASMASPEVHVLYHNVLAHLPATLSNLRIFQYEVNLSSVFQRVVENGTWWNLMEPDQENLIAFHFQPFTTSRYDLLVESKLQLWVAH